MRNATNKKEENRYALGDRIIGDFESYLEEIKASPEHHLCTSQVCNLESFLEWALPYARVLDWLDANHAVIEGLRTQIIDSYIHIRSDYFGLLLGYDCMVKGRLCCATPNNHAVCKIQGCMRMFQDNHDHTFITIIGAIAHTPGPCKQMNRKVA